MEINTTKQTLSGNRTILEQSAEIEASVDAIIPDTSPDIAGILKCRFTPRITSKRFTGTTLTLEGKANVSLIYHDSENCIYGYETYYEFSKKFEMDNEPEFPYAFCQISCESENARLITEKKAELNGTFKISVKVISKTVDEILCDIDEDGFQILHKKLPTLNSIGFGEKNLVLENELDLSQGQKSIRHIVRYDGDAVINEFKTVANKVIVKGALNINLLYCAEVNGQYQTYRSSVPFSQIIDITGVDDNCKCNCSAYVSFLEIKAKTSDEDIRTMLLNAGLCVRAEAYCESEINAVSDVYSVKNDLTIEKTDITVDEIVAVKNDGYLLKNTFSFSDGSLGNIIDTAYCVNVKNSKIIDGKITVSGEIRFAVLAYDTEDKIDYYDKFCDFTYVSEYSDDLKDGFNCITEVSPYSCGYTIISENTLELRIEMKVVSAIHNVHTEKIISDIEKCEKPKIRPISCALVVYFADAGESLWEIGKKYNSDIEEIKEFNNIESDIVSEKKKLLIPIK